MSIFSKIGDFLKKISQSEVGQVAEQVYINKLGDLFQSALQDAKAKDPVLAQSIVKTLAAWLPYLAEAAKKTGTDIDDKIVVELQNEIVAFDNTPETESGGDTPPPPPTPSYHILVLNGADGFSIGSNFLSTSL